MLARHGLAESIHLEEGSGISRGSRFTARGLARLLHLFEPHAILLRAGDGTRFKTGTIPGVRTLAGYADTSRHGRVRFVISLRGNDGAMRFRLLKAIQSGLQPEAHPPRRSSPSVTKIRNVSHQQQAGLASALGRAMRGTYFPSARGLATSRAQSRKSCATGFSVRFLRVTIPTGRGLIGNSIGSTLSGK